MTELPAAVHVRRTSTWSVITLGSSSADSVTTSYYCRTSGSDTIFEFSGDIDEYIITQDALEIDCDGGDSDVKIYEFELHINANETEYYV